MEISSRRQTRRRVDCKRGGNYRAQLKRENGNRDVRETKTRRYEDERKRNTHRSREGWTGRQTIRQTRTKK